MNQSQGPAFQEMIALLASHFGHCDVYTGMPHPVGASGEISLIGGVPYDRRSKVRRAWSWLRFLVGAALRALRLEPSSVIVAVTNPPLLPHLAWLLSRLKGNRYALVVWDLYPDHLVKMGWVTERSPLTRAWLALNRRAFRGADAVVAIGEGMRRGIVRQLGRDVEGARVVVIPNFADTAAIKPLAKDVNPFAREHGQLGKITVMYSGNIGATHGALAIAAAADALRDDPRVEFLVVGEGLGRKGLVREVSRRKLTNVRLLDRQPWSVLPLSLATAEIAVVTQAHGTEHLSVPSKTYSCLAAGSALLALTTPDSDLGRLVQEHEVGMVLAIDDVEGVSAAIRELVENPSRLARFRTNARVAAERHFSIAAATASFREVLGPAFGASAQRLEEAAR